MILFICVENSTPPRLQFFSFLCTTIPAIFHYSLTRFLGCKSWFLCFSPNETILCLMVPAVERHIEEPHHHLMAGILYVKNNY
jgi:hypothetical protein